MKNNFNTYCDIIIFTLSRWDSPISSPSLALAKEFAKRNRVFYIDHPYSLKDFVKLRKTPELQQRKDALLWGKNLYQKPVGLPENITIITPKITIPVNFLPKGVLYRSLSQWNDNLIFDLIRKIIADHDIKEYVFINFFDPYFIRKFPDDIVPLRKVYQSMDDISQVSYSNRHGTRLEEEIVRTYDFTLTTSQELTRLKSAFSPNVHFHPNAVDIEIFRKASSITLEKPKELQGIDKKIIGYTGSIEYRTDFELLKKIADFHQDKILFFVGPIGTDEHIKTGLDKMPNVIFAGPRKITELPAFLQYFDCVIIPFRLTTLTKSIYPLKINEYLAAGKPVIATHFSEDIYSFKEVAYIAENHEEFLGLIDRAIAENNDERRSLRLQTATQNTWEARVEVFWKIISQTPLPMD
ncbi:MAG: glycosyltransferase [Verrucomicrobia bacterium]|nr:glycosyltransferase [Cytophagales bacterium]